MGIKGAAMTRSFREHIFSRCSRRRDARFDGQKIAYSGADIGHSRRIEMLSELQSSGRYEAAKEVEASASRRLLLLVQPAV